MIKMMIIIILNKFDYDGDDLAVMVMMMILNELIMMVITDEIYNNGMRSRDFEGDFRKEFQCQDY